MHSIDVYRTHGKGWSNIEQLHIKRDWMDDTWNAHAYHCFPVSLANTMAWGISFPEDISFIWDGISDSTPGHVKVLQGHKYCDTGRANGSISFNTGIQFKTDENTTMLTMPVPNQFIEGAQAFTTLLSTSFFNGDFPAVWRITSARKQITIKAGTPVVAIVPISLNALNNSEMIEKKLTDRPTSTVSPSEYANKVAEINQSGKWADFYRNAINPAGEKIGTHEVKKIILRTNLNE